MKLRLKMSVKGNRKHYSLFTLYLKTSSNKKKTEGRSRGKDWTNMLHQFAQLSTQRAVLHPSLD